MFINKVNYPDRIVTHQELNIFFDYVVHGVLDECIFDVEFHGVKTDVVSCVGHVVVEVPIRVFSYHEAQVVGDTLKKCLREVCKRLVGNMIVPLTLSHIDVKVLVEIKVKPNIIPEVQPNNVSLAQRLGYYQENKEREEKRMYIPEVNEIRHTKSKRGEFFTVIWKDNTQTTVKLMEGDTSDEYTAYLYALGKKLFENKGEGRKFVREKKKVFEDRVAKKSAEKARQRREQAMPHLEVENIFGQVYDDMFVSPCLISRAMFRRNQ